MLGEMHKQFQDPNSTNTAYAGIANNMKIVII